MAAMMSWSMSWLHYSSADGELCGGGGLLSSCQATTSVASAATTGGSVTTVLAESWRYGASTLVAAAVWPPARRDRPALEREVASPSVSCS
jgi:hypothetical protein